MFESEKIRYLVKVVWIRIPHPPLFFTVEALGNLLSRQDTQSQLSPSLRYKGKTFLNIKKTTH